MTAATVEDFQTTALPCRGEVRPFGTVGNVMMPAMMRAEDDEDGVFRSVRVQIDVRVVWSKSLFRLREVLQQGLNKV